MFVSIIRVARGVNDNETRVEENLFKPLAYGFFNS